MLRDYTNEKKQRPGVFYIKAVLKNFAIFTLVLESLFNKIADLQTSNFIKNRLQHRYFPENTAEFLRTPILKNTRERLLLEHWPETG